MKLEKLREAMHAAPFQPFTIHVADGRSLHVPHPDFIAILGTGRTVFVTSPIDQTPSYLMIDVPMTTQLEVHGVRPNGSE
jgi:hypothetical protein